MIFKKTFKLINLRMYSTSQFLDMNAKDLKKFIITNKLKQISISQLQKSELFLKESGYTKEQLLKHAAIFKQPCHVLDQKISTLKEGGLQNISLSNILTFRSVVNQNIESLKESGQIPQNIDVAKSLLNYLDPPDCKIEINDLLDDHLTLSDIHKTILVRYLIYRLEAKENQITSLFRLHHRLNLKPFNYLCWNIKFALSIGYSNEKILKNIYILCTNPKNTEQVLNELPQLLAGVHVKNDMFVYPKMIGIPLYNFEIIYKTLKKHGITDEAIIKSMNIFTLSTKTVEKRLQWIQNQPQMRVLLSEPSTLKLIVHLNRAKNRLNTLRENKMKCATIRVLGTDGTLFDDHVKDGKDINYNQEIYRFIKRLLKCNPADIKEKVRLHPFFNHVPLTTIQDTYFYLKSLKFCDSDIQEVVQLLLYPRYKIKDGYNKCKEYCHRQGLTNIHDVQMLNLTLYFIEKDHHFTGNGIWNNNEENLL